MISIQQILDSIDYVRFEGEATTTITKMVAITDSVGASDISWCGDKYKENLLSLNQGSIVLTQLAYDYVRGNHKSHEAINFIIVNNPRQVFATILNLFFAQPTPSAKKEPTAVVHPSVKYDVATCYIGNNVVVEENCVLGKNVILNHNTVVYANSEIGNNVSIGSNCTIGGVGFGYELNNDGSYEAIPHIGNVKIHDNVEIGNNVCIDKAVLGSTTIGENVKIDNLVHIAHGVTINENSLIIANAMIAGSAIIGKNVWVAPSSSVLQKATVGDNSLVGMGSVVLKNVEDNVIVAGSPAKKIKSR